MPANLLYGIVSTLSQAELLICVFVCVFPHTTIAIPCHVHSTVLFTIINVSSITLLNSKLFSNLDENTKYVILNDERILVKQQANDRLFSPQMSYL